MFFFFIGEEIQKLYERIKKLLARNEQLTNLLKDAGITVPSEREKVKFKKPLPWTNKVSPEQAKILSKNENQSKQISIL